MLLGNEHVYIISKSSSVVQDQIIRNIHLLRAKEQKKTNKINKIYIE